MGRIFGTFGVRGVVGERITPDFAMRMAMAHGTFLKGGKIVVGTDTRTSGFMLKNAMVSGYLNAGSEIIDVGTAPTPAIQFACKHFESDGGASITASHNPPQYNGIKLLESDGLGLQPKSEGRVEDNFFENRFRQVKWDSIKKTSKRDILPIYINEILKRINKNVIKNRKPRVVLDCGNGAGCLTAPNVLEAIGCELIKVNCEPDGTFPGRDPEPIPKNLEKTCKIVKKENADFGLAMDGDADRCILIDENGDFIWGDRTFAMVAKDIVKRNELVVTTVATSHVVKDVVDSLEGKYLETKVGDLVVSKALRDKKGVLGGEENGGLIFPDFVLGRDATLTSARLCEYFSKEGKMFSELNKELPEYHQHKSKIHIPDGTQKEIMDYIKKNVVGTLVTIDGIKIIEDDSWTIIRPSGTEPLIRVFTESHQQKTADTENKKYVEMVNKCCQ
ncbi:phosphoglucosamine mutase [Candidatus Undinarchaeota archaeon]